MASLVLGGAYVVIAVGYLVAGIAVLVGAIHH